MNPDEEDRTELEKEFETLCESVNPKIQAKLKEAMKALEEAEKLAEKHGVPFYASISPLGNSYIPNSFSKKFSELDEQFVTDVTGVYSEYDGFSSGGWVHSAVC